MVIIDLLLEMGCFGGWVLDIIEGFFVVFWEIVFVWGCFEFICFGWFFDIFFIFFGLSKLMNNELERVLIVFKFIG